MELATSPSSSSSSLSPSSSVAAAAVASSSSKIGDVPLGFPKRGRNKAEGSSRSRRGISSSSGGSGSRSGRKSRAKNSGDYYRSMEDPVSGEWEEGRENQEGEHGRQNGARDQDYNYNSYGRAGAAAGVGTRVHGVGQAPHVPSLSQTPTTTREMREMRVEAAAAAMSRNNNPDLENIELRTSSSKRGLASAGKGLASAGKGTDVSSSGGIRRKFSRGMRRTMSIEEMLTKNTVEKWVQYGRFPAKMILHVLLLLLQSAQIIMLTRQMSFYHRFSTRAFENFFMPPACIDADNSPYPIGGFKDCYLFTQEEAVEQFKAAIDAVDTIQTESVEFYRNIQNASHPQIPQFLTIEFYNGEDNYVDGGPQGDHYSSFSDTIDLHFETYNVSFMDYGPFQNMSLANRSRFFHGMYKMVHTIHLGTWVAQVYRACITWEININYIFQYGGVIAIGIETNILQNWCAEETIIDRLFHNLNIFNWAIIALCIPYFGLICTSLYRSCIVYNRIKGVLSKLEGRSIGHGHVASAAQLRHRGLDAKARAKRGYHPHPTHGHGHGHGHGHDRKGSTLGPEDPSEGPSSEYHEEYGEFTNVWSNVTVWDKIRFFRWWVLCTFVAILTNTVASIMRLVHSYNNNQMGAADDEATMWLDSIGIALLYVQVLHYFEHKHEYFQLIATLQIGIPRVLKFLVGVAPLLLAYNFVGMIFFANYSDFFCNFGAGMITLFAVMNGDEVADSFDEMTTAQPWMAQIFWYTYICLFIFVVLNIFIAIIEAAHEVTELQHSTDFGGNVHDEKRPITKALLAQAMRLLNAHDDPDIANSKIRAREHLISTAYSPQHAYKPPPNPLSVNSDEQRARSTRLPATFSGRTVRNIDVDSRKIDSKTESLLDAAFGDDTSEEFSGASIDRDELRSVRNNSFSGDYAEEKQAALDMLLNVSRR